MNKRMLTRLEALGAMSDTQQLTVERLINEAEARGRKRTYWWLVTAPIGSIMIVAVFLFPFTAITAMLVEISSLTTVDAAIWSVAFFVAYMLCTFFAFWIGISLVVENEKTL